MTVVADTEDGSVGDARSSLPSHRIYYADDVIDERVADQRASEIGPLNLYTGDHQSSHWPEVPCSQQCHPSGLPLFGGVKTEETFRSGRPLPPSIPGGDRVGRRQPGRSEIDRS